MILTNRGPEWERAVDRGAELVACAIDDFAAADADGTMMGAAFVGVLNATVESAEQVARQLWACSVVTHKAILLAQTVMPRDDPHAVVRAAAVFAKGSPGT